MRAFILLLVVGAVAATTEKFKNVLRPPLEACKSEIGITEEQIDTALNLRVEQFDDKLKCLGACIMERLNIMKDDKFLPSSFAKRINLYKMIFEDHPERIGKPQDVVKFCSDEAEKKYSGNKCKVAYNSLVCVLSKHE